jgi:hypothetical protein
MPCELSPADRAFRDAFETGRIQPAQFDHRAHVRLVYCYLVEHDTVTAADRMRAALHGFLARHGVEPGKYHETLTRAWTMAVRHFMERTGAARSADDFMAQHPALLDPAIMLTHYSAARLFSAEARARWVEPDVDAIPSRGDCESGRH